ncbi:hypothetical protein BIW11_04965 [Tropilaelaps mercedesae]|uniref:Uncharacterized protein n=1 Tax=Tropilaelaps mercedesae TaxID=418985 RepID=A0A1V9WZP6_9ACAR|nr:hypothetical protein BIW11_04965 [Tropilaelaps mercedesae]
MEYAGVGSIKKIFGRQREPYGFVTIHQPPEAKGMEAVFYLKDVLVSEDERRLLQGGLIVRFAFTRKPLDRMKAPCPFKATQVRVQDPMEYKGTVARSAQGSLIVFLDVLFRQVRVPLLAQSATAGDRCSVAIAWKQMVRALRKNRDPVGQLVSVEHKRPSPKDSYLKDRDYSSETAVAPVPPTNARSMTSFAGSHDESEDDLLMSSFSGQSRLSNSRDSRDDPAINGISYRGSLSQSPYKTSSSVSSLKMQQHRKLHQLRHQHEFQLQQHRRSDDRQALLMQSGLLTSCAGYGLLGGSIWSMDVAPAVDAESRTTHGSNSSGASSPESVRRNSIGDSGSRWSDTEWHMQTVRIAEMALPGKR